MSTGTNPTVKECALNDANGLLLFSSVASGLLLRFRRRVSDAALVDPKLRLTILKSTGLQGWATLSTGTGTGAWSGLAPYQSIAGGGTTSHLFLTGITQANTEKYFLRLKAGELP